jgi:hypothetical protein
MKLSKATIRPGTVLKVLENGVIKASAPGLFAFVDDPEKMPPIMPWFIGHNSNAFSQPKVYDDVWIMNFADNPRQLYWFRKDEVSENDNIPMGEENVEVLCNRDIDGEWCTIYFSDGSGWVIGKGESIIQIRPNGSILLTNGQPNRCIDINGKNISIGKADESQHPAACGDAVEDALMSICSLLNEIGAQAMLNPHTVLIGTALLKQLPKIINKIPNISSQHVTIE